MTWFRLATGAAARLVQRRNAAHSSHHISSARRYFHSTNPTSKAAQPAVAAVSLSRLSDSFLQDTSRGYLESLQRSWETDPNSVDESWDHFFRNYLGQAPAATVSSSPGITGQTIQESMRLLLLVRAYQSHGHLKAKLNPLGITRHEPPAELNPELYGFTEADLDREFFIGVWRMSGFLSENKPVQTLRSILQRLEQAYCGSIGFEYMHIPDREKCNWLRERIELAKQSSFDLEHRWRVLENLAWSSMFEGFLGTKWPTAKRFGMEGAETIVAGTNAVIDKAAELGIESIVMATPHRGRMNALANLAQMPLHQIFTEFAGKPIYNSGYTGTGDVKHHLGYSSDRITSSGKKLHVSLISNPSHLESPSPVVVGKTRAKQYYSGDDERKKNIAVLLHGDGCFAGQGVLYETLQMCKLPNYSTGGTIHIVNDNQVAFTTDPMDQRSSHYSTDVAKALNAPVFHVNGDDVEAVVRACELAVEWRQTFQTDVVVDILAYRRLGHNEIDEPFLTQPNMYKVIKSHQTPLEIYENKLVESKQFSKEEIDAVHNKINSILNEEFEKSKNYAAGKREWLSEQWSGLKSPEQLSSIQNTGVKPEVLKSIGKAITTLPEGFRAHKTVKRVYETRSQMIESSEGIDWPTAEALAFGTLISEGYHVRLSGQDVQRGTFSHRHAVLHDQETGKEYCPLDHIVPYQHPEMFTVSNSLLSEYGVLGYEMGYSLENPNSLVLWEAQFGDFANGAQVIFDNFLCSSEAKWLRQSGLTVLLPHGYDGQGPEHSSARLERFLQSSNEHPYVIPEMDQNLSKQIQQCNWQVVNITTPANYFHVLRRQMHREFRKPLIVIAPKYLLRHKDCKSNLSEFDNVERHPGICKQGTHFKRLIKDHNDHKEVEEGIKRLILCSGKVYYELDEERKKMDRKDVAICRVEQLCPFPFDLALRELKRYPNAEVVWCQEEPMNMGAYQYIAPRLGTTMRTLGRGTTDDVKYLGRPPSAATSTGYYAIHLQEQAKIVQESMQREPLKYPYELSL